MGVLGGASNGLQRRHGVEAVVASVGFQWRETERRGEEGWRRQGKEEGAKEAARVGGEAEAGFIGGALV